jgi:hypothetical protein
MRTALTLAVLAAGLLAALGGCRSLEGECNSCHVGAGFTTFKLACSANDITSVVAFDPCSLPDASLERYTAADVFVVGSPSPGVCYIKLTFATGFTYFADVTFTSQSGGCAGAATSLANAGSVHGQLPEHDVRGRRERHGRV